jgi:hypothetical protein
MMGRALTSSHATTNVNNLHILHGLGGEKAEGLVSGTNIIFRGGFEFEFEFEFEFVRIFSGGDRSLRWRRPGCWGQGNSSLLLDIKKVSSNWIYRANGPR